MSLTSRFNEYLKSITSYYRGVSCYVVDNTSADPDSILGSLKMFGKVECISIKDLISEGLLKKNVIICNERTDRCVYVLNGAKVDVIEVTGHEVLLRVDETLAIKEGDVLAYIVSGKGELRKYRSVCEGYIILIEELVGRPQGYLIYVVSGGYVREFKQ